MATKKKDPVILNLAGVNLERHAYPRNCGTAIVAEFQGGHVRGAAEPFLRTLTLDEWCYILHKSFWGNHTYIPTCGTISFSAKLNQTRKRFGPERMFNMFRRHGATGTKFKDEYYTYYTLHFTPKLVEAIKKAHTCPKTSTDPHFRSPYANARW